MKKRIPLFVLISYRLTWGIFLPMIFIFILSFSTIYQILTLQKSTAPEQDPAPVFQTPNNSPVAYLFIPQMGASSSDVLLAAHFFHTSKTAVPVALALTQKPIPLTSGVDILPQLDFSKVNFKKNDILLIPSPIGALLPQEEIWLNQVLKNQNIKPVAMGLGKKYIPDPQSIEIPILTTHHLRTRDYAYLFFQSALFWSPPKAGIWLSNGVPDFFIAHTLELLSRTLAFKTVTLAEKEGAIQTASGLYLSPKITSDKIPILTHLFYDQVIEKSVPTPLKEQLKKEGTELQAIQSILPVAEQNVKMLSFLESTINTPTAQIIAYLMDQPYPSQHKNYPWIFLIRFFGLVVIFSSLGKFYQGKFFKY